MPAEGALCHHIMYRMQQTQIDRYRSAAIPAQQLFIGGQPEPAISEARLDVVSPWICSPPTSDTHTDLKTAWTAL